MRLVKRHIDNDGSGSVTLMPEEPEDMVRRQGFWFHVVLSEDSGMLTTSSDLQTSSPPLPYDE
jgi:hypothetical protein